MDKSQNEVLSRFLKDLATQIDDNKITESELQKIGEFFINYIFSKDEKTYTEEEWLKFTTMGWFVYNCLK